MELIKATDSDFVPASHEDPRSPGVLKRVIAVAARFQSGHVQMLNWARLPVGSSFRPHYHEDMQEIFVLISGSVRMQGPEQSLDMAAGDTVIVDPREIHQMTNVGNQPADYIVFGISSQQGGRTVLATLGD